MKGVQILFYLVLLIKLTFLKVLDVFIGYFTNTWYKQKVFNFCNELSKRHRFLNPLVYNLRRFLNKTVLITDISLNQIIELIFHKA